MLNILKLFNFTRVFPFSLLSSISFFITAYFLTKANTSTTGLIISLLVSFICFVIFICSYTIHNRIIASEFAVQNFDSEQESLPEVIEAAKKYSTSYIILILIYLLAYNIIIPAIGSLFGAIFQLSIFDFDFNILTLILNLGFISWVLLGTAEVVTLDASFLDTIKYSISFMFDNFVKMILFCVIIGAILFLFQFTLVSTYLSNQYIMMPIKILTFAYLFSVLNSYTIDFFAKNVSLDEETDSEDNN